MSSYKFVVAPLRAVGEVVSPFCIRTALALKELIGLAYAKSRREPERIVRVVVVDCAVGIHIHEIVGVARIRGTEPPIIGEAGYGLNRNGAAPAYRPLSLRLILEI